MIGGDWQVTPEEMRASGFAELLGGTSCATRWATNLTSKRCVDFFVVSDILLKEGCVVKPVHGCNFATHVPVILTLEVARTKHENRRLAMPRQLPMKPPIGPRQVKTGVNWAGWKESVEVDARQGIDSSSLGKLVDAWYAGAEQELLETFDLDNDGDGDDFLGIGLIRNEAMGCSEGRFRDTPDWTGLLGQRLGWTSKALHLTWRHGSALINDHGHEHMQVREAKLDMLRRFGYRACALLKS